jgi:hypothetical protein
VTRSIFSVEFLRSRTTLRNYGRGPTKTLMSMMLLLSLLGRSGTAIEDNFTPGAENARSFSFFPISSSIGNKRKRKNKEVKPVQQGFFLLATIFCFWEVKSEENRNGFVNLWGEWTKQALIGVRRSGKEYCNKY